MRAGSGQPAIARIEAGKPVAMVAEKAKHKDEAGPGGGGAGALYLAQLIEA